MSLIHRTNYYGREINASNARHDEDVDLFDAIWTQFSPTRRGRSCCYGFGKRRVFVEDSDFIGFRDGEWNLYLVYEQEGRNENHYFYKFVLIPPKERNYGKHTCIQNHHWKWIGGVDADDAMQCLKTLLLPYYEGERNTNTTAMKHHCHVGLKMDTLSAY